MRAAANALAVLAVLAGIAVIAVGLSTGGAGAPVVRLVDGFGPPEDDQLLQGTAYWVTAPTANIELSLARDAPAASVRMALISFERPRRVAIALNGEVLRTARVTPGAFDAVTVPLGPLGRGEHTVSLTAMPGLESIDAAIGNGDLREVSVRLAEPVVVSTGG